MITTNSYKWHIYSVTVNHVIITTTNYTLSSDDFNYKPFSKIKVLHHCWYYFLNNNVHHNFARKLFRFTYIFLYFPKTWFEKYSIHKCAVVDFWIRFWYILECVHPSTAFALSNPNTLPSEATRILTRFSRKVTNTIHMRFLSLYLLVGIP